MADAKASDASKGEKCPQPDRRVTVTSEKNSCSRSLQSTGNSGSCSGHKTRVGAAIRSRGAGVRSARLLATVPEPARYHPIEAVNAPGSA
jgi:hypothetical protein